MLKLNNIRAEMARNKISGITLAEILKISPNSLYRKLNGKNDFTATEIGLIAKELKTEVNFFY